MAAVWLDSQTAGTDTSNTINKVSFLFLYSKQATQTQHLVESAWRWEAQRVSNAKQMYSRESIISGWRRPLPAGKRTHSPLVKAPSVSCKVNINSRTVWSHCYVCAETITCQIGAINDNMACANLLWITKKNHGSLWVIRSPKRLGWESPEVAVSVDYLVAVSPTACKTVHTRCEGQGTTICAQHIHSVKKWKYTWLSQAWPNSPA